MSQNKVEFGLDKVHIAFVDESAVSGPAWETPIPITGAVSLSEEALGETITFYADNGPYSTFSSNNGYTGELVMALLPDAIKARIFGWVIDDNGMLVEVTDGKPERFALLGQIQGDKKNRRFVYYDCQGTRGSKERTTKGESVEVATDTLAISMSPIEIDGRTVTKGTLELSDTNAAVFNSFFTSIVVPEITTPTP